MDLCSTVLRYDIPQDKFLLRDGTQDLVVSGKGGWVDPLGYSYVLHDLCEANVRMDPGPPPPGFSWVQYRKPSSDSIRQLFRTGQTLYWMSERGAGCVPVRVKETPRPPRGRRRDHEQMDATLGGFASIEVPDGTLWGRLDPLGDGTYIPFAAMMPEEGSHGFLFMGTWQTKENHPFFKCQCERLFRFMNLEAHHLEVLPRRFPSDPRVGDQMRREVPVERSEARYYDSEEIEKWFWDKDACEGEREAALKRIASDGRETTKSGFYSGYYSFEAWYGFQTTEADRR